MAPIRTAFLAVALAGSATASPQPPAAPIRLNQIGLLPDGAKRALLPDAASAPLGWTLTDATGKTVASGMTRVTGDDAASGEHLHLIDFGSFRGRGEGFRLHVGARASRVFAIRPDLYAPLRRAAFNYFYQSRAGTRIEARYAGGERWARPAGHPHEIVTCVAGTDGQGNQWPGCAGSYDVTGGWYDAGDHGKYVVNGGIALWTLLDLYEQGQRWMAPPFPDGAAALPEAGNGVSDLLDEARWEIEFLLAMQAPAGTTVAVAPGVPRAAPGLALVPTDVSGMAFHKVADARWTALPTPPQDDHETRILFPPSTAATLNLAATAAQCARIWRSIDAGFAARCLDAAKRAFAAAEANPDIYPIADFTGSGVYGDATLADEFYWAAAELFVTTGETPYRTVIEASPFFRAPRAGEFGWATTATLGTITLATVPNALPQQDITRLRQSIVAAADAALSDDARIGYRIPYDPPAYPWGSNSNLLNRAMLLALAADITAKPGYRDGVIDAMDYLLGRNPLDRSFVSGFGARPMTQPHHRFWAHAADAALPPPPPGVLSGGPNSQSRRADEIGAALGDCAPQTCWADDWHAFSLNEVAINWNAPLVWVAAWLDAHP
ncbi:glycoside hydrolase family 9 protein [Hephaestia sp. GCM10023244]|uniref:glycoside hydrolase family 9 protein n=1 Tax=unclassified Hephaestia TaxID=2631281 RepID=UPI002076DAA1|nr:glycoside hydrolase family 9 protein [Hephaestia sp. MAHUQ-44]MCM8730611.1 glycoside hydrolase family 9 protein [Hephaestia sp. MAHUQ-44]